VCDGLTDAAQHTGKDPSTAKVDAYAAAVDCMYTRQVHRPTDWWDRVGPKDARAAFDKLLGTVLKSR
jgi:hypothetical protein